MNYTVEATIPFNYFIMLNDYHLLVKGFIYSMGKIEWMFPTSKLVGHFNTCRSIVIMVLNV